MRKIYATNCARPQENLFWYLYNNIRNAAGKSWSIGKAPRGFMCVFLHARDMIIGCSRTMKWNTTEFRTCLFFMYQHCTAKNSIHFGPKDEIDDNKCVRFYRDIRSKLFVSMKIKDVLSLRLPFFGIYTIVVISRKTRCQYVEHANHY